MDDSDIRSDNSQKADSDFTGSRDDDLGGIAHTVKKLLTAGIGAAFVSEEGIRNYLSDIPLPKDVMKMLLQGAQKSKDEITTRVSQEIVDLMEKIDWSKEASAFLQRNRFKISIELEIEERKKSGLAEAIADDADAEDTESAQDSTETVNTEDEAKN